MKKPFLILIVFVCAIVGCKLDEAGFKQNSAANTTSGTLVGMWFIKTQITTGTALGFPIDDTETSFTAQDYYLFNSDNTVKVSSVDTVATGNYTYDPSAKKLTISNSTGGGTFTVNKLTADSLILFTTVSVPALATTTNVTLKLTH